ncbi:MAG: hypothetical protein EPN47_20500 [Acidobacteria bacterium]|nr:MAG: hypothetical protein EPN47_20500 [Acidobacteriota bacterium]
MAETRRLFSSRRSSTTHASRSNSGSQRGASRYETKKEWSDKTSGSRREIRLHMMLRGGIDYEEFYRRGSHAGTLGVVALV